MQKTLNASELSNDSKLSLSIPLVSSASETSDDLVIFYTMELGLLVTGERGLERLGFQPSTSPSQSKVQTPMSVSNVKSTLQLPSLTTLKTTAATLDYVMDLYEQAPKGSRSTSIPFENLKTIELLVPEIQESVSTSRFAVQQELTLSRPPSPSPSESQTSSTDKSSSPSSLSYPSSPSSAQYVLYASSLDTVLRFIKYRSGIQRPISVLDLTYCKPVSIVQPDSREQELKAYAEAKLDEIQSQYNVVVKDEDRFLVKAGGTTTTLENVNPVASGTEAATTCVGGRGSIICF